MEIPTLAVVISPLSSQDPNGGRSGRKVTPILCEENLRPKGEGLVPIGISGRTRQRLVIQSVTAIVLLNSLP